MFKVTEIKLPSSYNKEDCLNQIAKKLNVQKSQITDFKLIKRAVDARKKQDVCYSCNFAVDVRDFDSSGYAKYLPYEKPHFNVKPIDVVVVGSGPSGLFCALLLAESGAKVTVLERGDIMDKRIKAVESYLKTGVLKKSNIQMGEGGAGTFSDGKLNTSVSSLFNDYVLNTFYENGASEDILYDSKPHVGTDVIRKVVVNIRKKIESLNGKFIFNATFTDFEKENGKIRVFYTKDKTSSILCDRLVLALGYSARDTHRQLCKKGLKYHQKAFSVGYRIEHLQEDINKAQLGKFYEKFPPADYKLFSHLPDGRTVYTFCMCPGGEVVPAVSEDGQIVTNGMSYYKRDNVNSNSAVLVSVSEKDYKSLSPLAGMDYQEKLEKKAFKLGNGKFIVQRLEDFYLNKKSTFLGKVKPTIKPKYELGNLNDFLDKNLNEDIKKGIKEFGKKLKGFDDKDAILTGIETRSSAPFYVERKENFQTNFENVYAVGEGAGMAGGIVSSAVDGLIIAKRIIDENN